MSNEMPDPVKHQPVPPTTRRKDRARQTRSRIVEAGHSLFLQRGYAGTTLDAIAAEASVAVQTVYFHFGNKRTVLKEVMDRLAVNDDQPVPLLERPWVARMRGAPSGRAVLEIWMAESRGIFARVAPMLRIVRDAAASDPEMAEQWQANQQQTARAHRFLAHLLDDRGELAAGLSVDAAADSLFALISLETYVLLTGQGWDDLRWTAWVTDVAAAAVLADAGQPARDRWGGAG